MFDHLDPGSQPKSAEILDTQTDSPAEFLYAKAGWTRFGVMP